MSDDFITLAQKHPLFSRLSGQVIWYLFEERDIPVPVIEAFMDKVIVWLRQWVDLLRPILEDEPGAPGFLRIHLAKTRGAGQACSFCQGLEGKILRLNEPNARRFLPPYSVGCRTRAELLHEAPPDAVFLDTTVLTPPKRLHCDTDWLFEQDWTTNAELPSPVPTPPGA